MSRGHLDPLEWRSTSHERSFHLLLFTSLDCPAGTTLSTLSALSASVCGRWMIDFTKERAKVLPVDASRQLTTKMSETKLASSLQIRAQRSLSSVIYSLPTSRTCELDGLAGDGFSRSTTASPPRRRCADSVPIHGMRNPTDHPSCRRWMSATVKVSSARKTPRMVTTSSI